jgi:hypothetical protein
MCAAIGASRPVRGNDGWEQSVLDTKLHLMGIMLRETKLKPSSWVCYLRISCC